MTTPQKDGEKPAVANPFAAFGAAAGGPLLFGGNSGSTTFSFSASTFGSAVKKDDDEDEDADGDDGGDDEGNAAADESHAGEFKALVSLEKVEVKSGEDDEDVLFKSRAKLYVFVKEDIYGDEVRKNWWRERGLGDAKILKDRTTSECRFLMRQEKTLKICANHKIDPSTELLAAPNGQDKSWNFTAVDFADGEPKTHLFAIKFGQTESAASFKQAFEEAKNFNKKVLEGKGATGGSSISTPAKAAEKPKATPAAAAPTPVAPAAPKVSATPVAPAQASASVDDVAKSVSGMNVGSQSQNSAVRVGGFGKCNEDDPSVKAAVKFAVEKIGKGSLVKLASVKSQVVAGTNFRMALHIKHDNGEVHAHVVTVFQPLPHTNEPLKLTDHVVTGKVA